MKITKPLQTCKLTYRYTKYFVQNCVWDIWEESMICLVFISSVSADTKLKAYLALMFGNLAYVFT